MKRKLLYTIQKILSKRGYVLASSMPHLYRDRRFEIYDRADYVRLSSLELVSDEIYRKKIPGSVAEVGVYKGEFAMKINMAFPDRPLYLFDTFSGFDKDDEKVDRENNWYAHNEDFSDTDAAMVLNKMPYPEKCVIKKGVFPDTAKGIEDDFVFVSLDADLYKPTNAGLRFFWPRLAKGGYVFVHDYSPPGYKGVREAVNKFCDEIGIGYVPLSDGGGSVGLAK